MASDLGETIPPAPQAVNGEQSKEQSASPSLNAADLITHKLVDTDERIPNTRALLNITDKAFGGTTAEGKYTIKDAYDALEMGVNSLILNRAQDMGINTSGVISAAKAGQALKTIDAQILSRIPTQANRTAEQQEFQQFSTPPNLAYVANWLLNAEKGDTVLEPSAGVGGLAVFAKNSGAKVVVNELSPRRAELLKEMGFDEVYTENAEQIDNILPDSVKPTRIIMNPPFSSTAGRIEGKRDTKNATLHVEQALKRLEQGGRAVVILGKGMADDAPAFKAWWNKIKSEYNVRANIELSGEDYKKYGTTFGNVMAVIDKTGPTPEGGTLAGKYDSIADALRALEPIRNGIQNTTQAPKKLGVARDFGSYNERRYSKPWGARIIYGSDGKPSYDFKSGYYNGDGDGGTVTISNPKPGDIVAFGQKDFKKGTGLNDWYIVQPDGNMKEGKCCQNNDHIATNPRVIWFFNTCVIIFENHCAASV
jgi:predicted RNA methylase